MSGWPSSRRFPRRPSSRSHSCATNERRGCALSQSAPRREDAMTDPTLAISCESVSFIIVRARAFDDRDVVADGEELRAFIAALTEAQQVDLVALMWLGRGDGTLE